MSTMRIDAIRVVDRHRRRGGALARAVSVIVVDTYNRGRRAGQLAAL